MLHDCESLSLVVVVLVVVEVLRTGTGQGRCCLPLLSCPRFAVPLSGYKVKDPTTKNPHLVNF
jgi:hypothetical protein